MIGPGKMKWEVTFRGTAEEWEAEQERTVCRARPSPHSTARCEMPKGHDPDGPYLADLAEAEMRTAAFHAGRTRGGYWKFWPVEKEARMTSRLNARQQAVAALPGVTRLDEPGECTGFKAHTPLKAVYRMGGRPPVGLDRYKCKNRARWRFRAPENSGKQSGDYCWAHLLSRALSPGSGPVPQ